MIPIFERIYPNAIGEFFFDQSSAHGAFAPNALNAKDMNVKPGGKQRIMPDTIIPLNNPHPDLHGKPQQMVFPTDLLPNDPNFPYRGQPKGMRQILDERGLILVLAAANGGKYPVGECQFCKASRETQEHLTHEAQAVVAGDEPDGTADDVMQPGTSSTCCMRKCLASELDFQAEKPLLQITIENAGHKCYFLPKFHCELNPIEMYWGWTKIHACFLFPCLS